MSPTADKKDSLYFLSDYYFDTKSPVAFTSPDCIVFESDGLFSFSVVFSSAFIRTERFIVVLF